jgi:epoxide hydrolase 4
VSASTNRGAANDDSVDCHARKPPAAGGVFVISGYVQSQGARLHYVEQGTGPVVVLLHGIPESWSAWRRYISALDHAGYRAVAADLRGYNLSDKPRAASAYRGTLLAEDVARVIQATGEDRASVLGQSWGGLAAWLFAMRYPELLDRLVIMNVPHPLRWVEALRTWSFLRRNWHLLFFQLPALPELLLGSFDYSALRRTFERDLGNGGVDANTIDDYVEAMRRPGALTGALNYYRAFFRENGRHLQWTLSAIDAPVLIIWGSLDRFFPTHLAWPPPHWVPNARVEIVPGARHWTHHDEPDVVLRLLLGFLGE